MPSRSVTYDDLAFVPYHKPCQHCTLVEQLVFDKFAGTRPGLVVGSSPRCCPCGLPQ
jgi:hypothetical protein